MELDQPLFDPIKLRAAARRVRSYPTDCHQRLARELSRRLAENAISRGAPRSTRAALRAQAEEKILELAGLSAEHWGWYDRMDAT